MKSHEMAAESRREVSAGPQWTKSISTANTKTPSREKSREMASESRREVSAGAQWTKGP